MMIAYELKDLRMFMGRLQRGDDLHFTLLKFCEENNIRSGAIQGLGAFDRCQVCEYDQDQRLYRPAMEIKTAVEVLNLTGNVSLRDGRPNLHVHATLSYEWDAPTGRSIRVVGGHVVEARAFSFEFSLLTGTGPEPARTLDPSTGLYLWAMPHVT
jgi:predicted DNA-binding protein with PD1-like motif